MSGWERLSAFASRQKKAEDSATSSAWGSVYSIWERGRPPPHLLRAVFWTLAFRFFFLTGWFRKGVPESSGFSWLLQSDCLFQRWRAMWCSGGSKSGRLTGRFAPGISAAVSSSSTGSLRYTRQSQRTETPKREYTVLLLFLARTGLLSWNNKGAKAPCVR